MAENPKASENSTNTQMNLKVMSSATTCEHVVPLPENSKNSSNWNPINKVNATPNSNFQHNANPRIVFQPQVVNYIPQIFPGQGLQFLQFMFNGEPIYGGLMYAAPVENSAKNNLVTTPFFQQQNYNNKYVNNKEALPVCTEQNSKIVDSKFLGAEDDDVIFMGEYKKQSLSEEDIANPKVEQNIDHNVGYKETESTTFKKRKTNKSLNPIRRNPKRKVQIEKKSMELALRLSETDDFKKPLRKYTVENSLIKRPSRQCSAIGSIHIPPKPLSSKDVKYWPIDGMHERPEYDPITGKIKPFDGKITSIGNKYNFDKQSLSNQNNETLNNISPSSPTTVSSNSANKTKRFFYHSNSEIKTLRHVIAYICQKKKLKFEKLSLATVATDEIDHKTDVNDLAGENKENKAVKPVVGETNSIQNSKYEDMEEREEDGKLKELLYNSCLLHCLMNGVNQKSLATYLMDFDSDVAIDWLNTQISAVAEF